MVRQNGKTPQPVMLAEVFCRSHFVGRTALCSIGKEDSFDPVHIVAIRVGIGDFYPDIKYNIYIIKIRKYTLHKHPFHLLIQIDGHHLRQ